MDKYQSLSHTQWECLYQVVFIPKRRRSTLYKELRPHLGESATLPGQNRCVDQWAHLDAPLRCA